MATEPEREIEKTLKEYARRRRGEIRAPGEMHPATRRLLQGEVARLRPRGSDRRTFWSIVLGRSGSQIALRVSVAATLLAVAGWLLVPALPSNSKPVLLLTQSKSEPDQKAATDQPASRGKLGYNYLPDNVQEQTSTNQLAERQNAAGDAARAGIMREALVRAGAAQNVPHPAADAESLAATKMDLAAAKSSETRNETTLSAFPPRSLSLEKDKVPAEAAPQAVPAGAVEASAKKVTSPAAPAAANDNSATLNYGAGMAAREYVQVNLAGDRRKAAAFQNNQGVLNSFRVEQTGDQIRVIDNDGSVYLGSVRVEAETAKRVLAREREALPRKAAGDQKQILSAQVAAAGVGGMAQAFQNYSFRVSGTNRSLNQRVVLIGNYAAAAPAVPALQPAATNLIAAGKPAAAANDGAAVQFQPVNSRILGRAVIGGTNHIEIDALPLQP
jgi:hypothetical protein